MTAKDIAARLGIAVSTVGRALSDDPRISAETKLKVQAVAAELGYVGNRAARMMRGAPSSILGLMVPDVRNSFYSAAAHALSEKMRAFGYQLVLSETGDDPQLELEQLKGLSASQAVGLIIVPSADPHADSVKLLETIPYVQLLRHHSSLDQQRFGIDDRTILDAATSHLTALGHYRIAYIGGPSELSTGTHRLQGYRDALERRGISEGDPDLVRLGPAGSRAHGVESLRSLLALAAPPTAIVTGSVQATHGLLDEILAQNISVPEELSIVGFGDEPGFSWWGGGLTTMALPVDEMVNNCATRLLDMVAPSAMADPYEVVSPGRLQLRASTAPLSVSESDLRGTGSTVHQTT
ncbi:LacI family DNA-binding transcriptional regulator [Rhodococcus sp. NPDC057014]|uniref:LacI family DNA-binding transcriptional regulator n=1 Tax=Rhodococcus sp. NPDC057014 TaxID=3346000 RepID=UPI003635A80E